MYRTEKNNTMEWIKSKYFFIGHGESCPRVLENNEELVVGAI